MQHRILYAAILAVGERMEDGYVTTVSKEKEISFPKQEIRHLCRRNWLQIATNSLCSWTQISKSSFEFVIFLFSTKRFYLKISIR